MLRLTCSIKLNQVHLNPSLTFRSQLSQVSHPICQISPSSAALQPNNFPLRISA
ncbi:MAG: hypothetical protein ACTS4T_00740 [Candidatus Hodgkinia cicadicola]